MAEKVLGIDVSHWEPQLDWKKAKAAGVRWMYTKATEGTSNVDGSMNAHVGSAKAAGVLTGVYHFFHASQDAKKQADHFLKTIKGMSFEMPMCLDWEASSADGQSALIQKARALIWLDIVEKATGRPPVIYGGESFLIDLKLGSDFAKYPLWLAHYGCTEARLKMPKPWARYTMWQYTDAESVPGLAKGHHVDANWFKGSEEDLKKFANS